jgi:hypothetical protein
MVAHFTLFHLQSSTCSSVSPVLATPDHLAPLFVAHTFHLHLNVPPVLTPFSRFLDRDCDLKKFKALLQLHSPHSAIIMAGGGNFNDFYWEDQPSRIRMVKEFPGARIRAFPQSIHMTHENRINETKESFGNHKDLELTARDAKSYAWLEETFPLTSNVTTLLLPDIAFMWGNRPDIRMRVKKT